MSLPVVTLRIDQSGTAFGVAPTWTNQTAYLPADSGVTITAGRGDEQSETQPGTCSFLLENLDGRWTPGHPSAAAGWDIGALVNARVTASGTTYDRFTGYVDSIEPTWPGGVQSWSVVQVSCTDVLARLAAMPLRSMALNEVDQDNPTYLYELTEPDKSTSAGSSGSVRTAGALVPVSSKYGAGDVTFAAGTGIPTDGTSTVLMNSTLSSLAADDYKGTRLSGQIGAVSDLLSVEAWFVASSTLTDPLSRFPLSGMVGGTPTTPGYTPLLEIRSSAGILVGALVLGYDTAVRVGFVAFDNFALPSSTFVAGPSVGDGHLHHAVVTNDPSGALAIYVDGVQVLTTTGVATTGAVASASLTVGQRSLSGTNLGPAFRGSLQNVAIYPTALTSTQVSDHYKAGITAFAGERSDQRFARLLGYAGITASGLPTGKALMGTQSLVGKSITDALQQVARTENGPMFVTGAGVVTFQRRDTRYNASATLTLSGEDVNPDASVRRDRQGFANELTVTRDGGATQTVRDTVSQAAVGRFDGGSLDVAPATDFDALQIAGWLLAVRKVPQTRFPGVTIDLLTQTSAVVTAVLSAGISTLATINNLPWQAPASAVSVFVEGWTETISSSSWQVSFFTSPNLPFRTLRADASPSAYTALDAGLVIPL